MDQTTALNQVKPYRDSKLSKKEQVTGMFDHIAFRYDLLNHLLSWGIDRIWRRRAIRLLRDSRPRTLLDVATGTGDFALTASGILGCEKIVGIDLSGEMLAIAQKKVNQAGLQGVISLREGDGEAINFPDGSFDAVTVAFGLRNFENLEKGVREMARVLHKGGKLVILECSPVEGFPMKHLFQFYFHRIMPTVGKWISRDSSAYGYLPASVKAFPSAGEMVQIINRSGFHSASCKKMTFGICTIYSASR